MRLRTIGVVSSLAMIAGLSSPAFAQDADETQNEEQSDEGQRINVITVTAEFREANLQDTPIAITAVNSEMLEARGQTDIAQVAAQAPNVTLKPQPQNGGAGLIAFIRGVGQTDFNYALDPGVGVYVDDVYIPTLSSSLLDLMDLDRVEVLRGPQGTLAGKNSIGGAIKLFSAKPEGDGSGSLQVTYGSYNRLDVRGMADFGVADNLFARVSGVAKSRDGYVDLVNYGRTHPDSNVPASDARGANAVVGTQGGQSYVAGRLALRWIPTDRIEVNISGDYTSDRSEPAPTVLIAAGAVADSPELFDPTSQNPGTNANGGAWLPGKDGTPVPVDCRFVPAGQYGCDTLSSSAYGGDRRYISYANFLDSMLPTSQAPYKPYAALQNQDFTGWGVHGNVTFDVNDSLQLVWISSYRKYESKFGQDQDATPVPVAQLDNKLNHRAWSQELRINGEFGDGFLEYTLGGFYFDQNGRYTARVDLNYAGIDFIHGPDTTPSTSKAVFLNTTLHPTENWSITGGLRYTKDKKTYTYYRSNPDGTVPFEDWTPAVSPAPICEFFLGAPTAGPTGIGNTPNCLLSGLYGISDTFEGDRWDWRLVTDYRFSDAFLAYASVATGFKGGGVNPRPFFGPSAGECDAPGYTAPDACNQLKSFDPETITTYEIGFKADLLDRRLRLNGAGFFNKYNDIILTLSACPSIPCLQPNNVGKADVKGFELEMQAYPVDGLSLDGGLSYIDFEYKDTGSSGISLDAVTPYTPKWTYSFGIQYDYELESNAVVSARFDGAYQSDLFTESNNSEWSRVQGYFLGNARVSFTSPDTDWRLSLEVQNLFDKYYFLSVSDVSTSLGVVTGVPGLPRTWAATVRRTF
ncbi:iron complex outermembrane receptor protein [Altererythrobacter atlanticus]|uniref:Ferripyoverdine receptor n=1 Tax=Croceibacterium atlanticum TaxID=1267766 RepID=A0A0F7KUB3_9SPHN|nr:TonB-dependent receptor [Croceibacterium atlanticum]AKH43199.1 Ferripyoverdine receptor precursor [Croceibacterium atlanticum]MBB5732096.1 iron complex outermembrane receptor protein [Croceibacterium atlanticum]